MLAALACLIGIFGLLMIAEFLGRHKVLKGESHRKFLHITAGCFIASWPWLISWETIKIIGLMMVAVTIFNRYANLFNYRAKVGRVSDGDIFFAISVALLPFLTTNKIFFAIAMLEVALADGLAAVGGKLYGKKWGYKVLGHKKTLIGSMIFWLTSLCIFGAGLLWSTQLVPFNNYALVILLAPPLLTATENLSFYGLDNLVIPILSVLILKIAQG